jgi:hypothetical protein
MASHAVAEIKIAPPAQSEVTLQLEPKPKDNTNIPQTRPSGWHFQATYGLSAADVETPAWDAQKDPVSAIQKSTSGVFTDNRFGHSFETAMNSRQSVRMGLALFNAQSVAPSKWMIPLTGRSQSAEWRTWGIGSDFFLVRRASPNLDLDAGLQADYFVSGVTTLSLDEKASAGGQNTSRLEQKSGWRVAFSGGIGGLYIGPVGLVMRVAGQVMQAQFKGHTSPLRVQGMQFQMGAGLALGRGEP